jgi:hypothetical protein
LDLILVDVRSGRRRTFPLSERPTLLGRGVDCDVVLPDPEIDEHCCRISESRGQVKFESLTAEGATINGFAVRTAEVHSGDVIRIGPFQLVIAVGDRAAAAFAEEPARARSGAAASARAREEPRPVSTRRRPQAKSNVGAAVFVTLLAVGGIGGGIWFWKSHLSTPEPAPSDVGKRVDGANADPDGETKGDAKSEGASDPGKAPASSESGRSTPSESLAGKPKDPSNGAAGNGTPVAPASPENGGDVSKSPPPPTHPGEAATPSEELYATLQRVTRLLEAEEYSRCRWLLSQTKPGTPKERQAVVALQVKVDSTAAKAGDEYLAFVDKLVAKGWVMPALNHLQDESIDRFRGLEIWYRMTERADQLEDEVDKVVTADRRPMPRVKHARPRPANAASLPPPQIGVTDTERDWESAAHATVGAAPVAAGAKPAPARAVDPLTEARHAVDGLRFEEAAVVLETMPRSQLGESREAKRRRLAAWAAAAKRGAGSGKEAVDAKAAVDKLAAARAADHAPREWLDVAWFALAAHDEATFDLAIAKAAAEGTLKEEVDSALAFRRGLDGVPTGGFVLADGRWLTAAERDSAVARAGLVALIEKLAKVHESGLRDATANLVEAAKATPAVATDLLRERAAALGKQLADCPERAALEAMRARVQALTDARAAALAFAFDDASYPPRPGADAAALKKIADGNKELEKRIQAVRQVWGNEQGSAPEPVVDLSDEYVALVRQAQSVQTALREIKQAAPDDPAFAAARLLPGFTSKVTVRNCALTAEERLRIDEDRETKARNQNPKDLKNPADQELLNLIASYREMLGLPQLAFDPKLYGDARAYCEVMAPQAKKEKDDAPQPEPRLAAEQPKPIAGEIYLRGKFSARQALTAWQRLPGSHRDLLFARHRSVGPANVGNFWTCTFGLADSGK